MAFDKPTCSWVGAGDTLYHAYHDLEWGVPERDSRALYEKLMLDGFQAGLAWITVLRKRDALRAAFDGFDPERVARYTDEDIARLLADARIIRSRAKITAAVAGARTFLAMRERGEDFSAYLWNFVDGRPIQNTWRHSRDAPTSTDLSTAIARDLKRRGFMFCGPTIVYAFMQAVGMVNDHEQGCWRHEPVRALGD